MDPIEFLDALLALPSLSHVQLSWDGRWVAWAWWGLGPAADVYAAPTDGSRPPLRLSASDQNTTVVSWAPDARSLIVGEDHDGDERVQLFRIDLDRPLQMVPLTLPRPHYYLQGGELHPDQRWLFYAANLDAATGEEIEPAWLYRQDIETGEQILLAAPTQPGDVWPQLNSHGTHVLYPRHELGPAGQQFWLVGSDGTGDREILNAGDNAKVDAWWFPDGRRVLALAEAGTHRRLGIWDLAGGPVRWVLDDPERNLEGAFVPPGSDRIVLAEVREAHRSTSFLDPETGRETPWPPIAGNLSPLGPVGAEAWAGIYYHSRQPPDIVRFAPWEPGLAGAHSLTRVWDLTPLHPEDFVPAEDFRWQAPDGLEIQGWLYRARGQVRGTIVHVHGGPTGHAEDAINPLIQFLAHAGFHVLDPNFRGSTGFGLGFEEAIEVDGWGGRELDDIRSGIQALMDAGLAQAGRVGITGVSYGGYAAWCAITRWPLDLVAAAVPICGMTDLVLDYETTRPDGRSYTEEMMGGRPDQVPERYYDRSPVNFLENIRGRLLIVQGLQDPNVTPANVGEVTGALEGMRIPFELLAFADEGHGISRPQNQRTLFLRMLDFFDAALAG